MYEHLSFPEYVIQTLTQSVKDFEPNYMMRYARHPNFKNAFNDFDSFFEFYSLILSQAKVKSRGEIKLVINPDYPTIEEGFTGYCFYDEVHVHPVITIEVLIEGDVITLSVPPF